MNLKELDNNGTVEGFVLVKSCDKKSAKNGSTYIDMTLADKAGEINAKMWDWREGAFLPEVNSIIKIRGVMSVYNGTPQLRVDRARVVWDNDNVNMADIIPSADYEGKYMMQTVRNKVNAFENAELKKLVNAVLDEYGDKMTDCPAAFRLHHAIRGGLLMHTLSIVKMCECVASIYPTVDRELLISGAILHDVCKTDEFIISSSGLVEGYTPEGHLVGHLVMGAIAVDRIARENNISKDTSMLLEHMLISHHGEPEFGAATRPLFLEAEILSELDSLDANIYEIESCLADVAPKEFSNRQWALHDRKFYNHGRKVPETKVNLD
ncbi:MAG: HD domain-containing protein [Clostridia bacterium]|nr:HD domain-containing protein [Clostridia bacterium]